MTYPRTPLKVVIAMKIDNNVPDNADGLHHATDK